MGLRPGHDYNPPAWWTELYRDWDISNPQADKMADKVSWPPDGWREFMDSDKDTGDGIAEVQLFQLGNFEFGVRMKENGVFIDSWADISLDSSDTSNRIYLTRDQMCRLSRWLVNAVDTTCDAGDGGDD